MSATPSGIVVAPFAGAAAEWDDFGARQAGWTAMHRYGWKRVIEEAFGHECLFLAARDPAGRLAGVLPLVRVRSLVFGHYLVSMPFLNYGGPLGTDAAVAALAAGAAERAERDGVKLLELRSRVPLTIDLPVSHRKVTVVLDLPSDPDQLWKRFEAKLRSQVRRPQKEGVEVRFGRVEVGPFFDVFSRHMRDLGTPTMPRRFFELVAEEFGDEAWFGCAYLAGRPIAAGAGFRWGAEFEMTWASALTDYKKIAPNMLLYWAFMQRAIAEGMRLFNFGRCTPGAGTHRFKLQWGSRDEQLWWYQAGRSAARESLATPSPDDGPFAWGPKVWKHLPLPLATALGPHIVRSIP